VSGELWVSTNAGLFRSTDAGETFTHVGAGSISSTEHIAFGKGEGEGWNVYAFGIGSSGAKLYATADNGATWVDVQGTQGFGSMGANRVAGSGNVAGQVYVGTNGRGVMYAKVSVPGGGGSPSTSSAAPSPTETSDVPTTMTTSTVKTTSSTTTSSAPATTTSALAQRWQQCAGNGWQGPTQCVEPWKCQKQNDWYSQCL
jgi:xyloglucan-specific exo-beta-1,4-glucanase